MSNAQVGTIYQQIIADVVESSRVDFEEGGVDDHVLEELRLGWQQKLSQLNVADFPWDPKKEAPPPPIANPPTVPSNAGNYQMNTPPQHPPQHQAPQHQNQGLTMPQMNSEHMVPVPQNQGPRIKPEPGLENNQMPPQHPQYQNPMLAMPNNTTAQQRAAQHLQNTYGQRASASINAIQNTAGVPQPGQQGQGQGQGQINPQLQHQYQMQQHQLAMQQQQQQLRGQPGQHQQAQRPQLTPEQQQQAYRMEMARRTASQQAQVQAQAQAQAQNGGPNGGQNPGQKPGQNSVNGAQNDGAGDEEVEGLSVIKRFDSSGHEISMGRIEIDGLIRQKIQAMGQSMEGGGLMLPLHQASTKSTRQRKVVKKNTALVGGGDMADDDDKAGKELDEDAINSDLDDPDDGLNDDEDDDDSMGHIMLCMYDKVQRVKNKWKCVMKDGVLTVNGKEYVFHKASGEYEW